MLLEKMEEIAFLHWWKDSGYRAEAWGIPAGIVSHGGGAGWALKSYKAMVNDTIANATSQGRTVKIEKKPRGVSAAFLPLTKTRLSP